MAIWAFLFLLMFVIKIGSKIIRLEIYTSLQANFLMYCHRGNLNYNYIIKKWIPIIYTQYTKSLLLHLELSFLSLIFKLTYIHAQHNIINVASSSIYFRLGMTFLANWEEESWISSVTKFDGFRTMPCHF